MGTAGTQSITGTDITTTLTAGTANINVTGGAFNHVVFSNIASPQTAGGSAQFNITTEDKYGNATPFAGLLYISSPLTDWTNPSASTILITSTNAVYFTQQEYAVSFTASNLGTVTVNCSFHRAMPQPVSIFASDVATDNQFYNSPSGHIGWSNSFTII